MPRFFFNVLDDVKAIDERGRELPDLEAARSEAHRSAAAIITEQMAAGKGPSPDHRIEVEDEKRRVVYKLPFGKLLQP